MRPFAFYDGYEPVMIFEDSQGEEIRVRPARSICLFPLAPIRNPPYIPRVFEIFDAPFETLLNRQPNPLPRKTAVCREFSAMDTSEIRNLTVPAADVGGKLFLSRWFKVSKSDNATARLVQALGELSDCLDPPRVPFTKLPFLMVKILRARRAATGDLKNWFYQIPIPLEWRRWFAMQCSCDAV